MLKTKSFKKLAAMFMTICMLTVCLSGMTFSAKATTPEVQLYYAQVDTVTRDINGVAVDCCYIKGYVSVNSGGSNKAVTCHYCYDGSTWLDASASYIRNDPAGYEVWYFTTAEVAIGTGVYWDFAIRYDVDGSTYWDNNSSNDYSASYIPGSTQSADWVLGKSVLIQEKAYMGRCSFWGTIILKNLAYTKTVGIRYSTDNWATYTDVYATYDSSLPNNLERWSFEVTGGASVKYALFYTVNGNTYWDNNFGLNYSL